MIHPLLDKGSFVIVDPGQTAGHTGAEVNPRVAKCHDQPARHIFTAVVTHTLDNSQCAAIANSKAFTRAASGVERTRSSTVESYIAQDHMLCAFAGRTPL